MVGEAVAEPSSSLRFPHGRTAQRASLAKGRLRKPLTDEDLMPIMPRPVGGDAIGTVCASNLRWLAVSIAVLIGVHDGLVLSADSASTLTVSVAPGTVTGVANVYDNANKIFNLYKGRPIGCITFGAGSIGNSSIGTLIKDIRLRLTRRELGFDPDNYTMQGVAAAVAKALAEECGRQPVASRANLNIGLLFGGFSTNQPLGESYSVDINAGVAGEPRELRPREHAGISWGGASEVLQRIVLGFSPQLYGALAEVSGGQGQPPVSAQAIRDQLNPLLVARLQAPIVFAPMPIQDAIELGRFLVHAACMFSRFLPGPQIVGGPIEIAAITKHEGFKWISRKHYYDRSLNQEPEHVVLD